jgi:5'-nucleotidase
LKIDKWDIIFFDLDNTLYSHEEAFEKAITSSYKQLTVQKLLCTNSLPIQSKDWFTVFKKHCDLFWPAYEKKVLTRKAYQQKRYNKTMEFFQLPYEKGDAEEFHKHYEKTVHNYVTPFPGVVEFLVKLKECGKKIGIITNGKKNTQINKIKKLGLSDIISENNIIISEEVGEEKPNKHIFDIVTLKWNDTRKKPLYIGDSWNQDVVGAINAGWDCIFLNSRKEHIKTGHKPVVVIDTFHDLKEYFQG